MGEVNSQNTIERFEGRQISENCYEDWIDPAVVINTHTFIGNL
jgi:hypothetical protein